MIALITPYQWIGIAAIIVYSATILSVIYVVISENRNPVRSLAWVTVLMFLAWRGALRSAYKAECLAKDARKG